MTLPTELTTSTKFSKYLAMFFFVLFPFAGFYLGMRYQQLISPKIQQDNTIQITKPTPTPDPTANWKTYTDNEANFMIKYPDKYPLTKNADGIFFSPIDYSNLVKNGRQNEIFRLTIQVFRNIDHQTTAEIRKEILETNKPGPGKSDPNGVMLDAYNKIVETMKPYKNGDLEGIYFQRLGHTDITSIIEEAKEDKIYYIWYWGYEGNPVSSESEKVIQQILSTFKFTDQQQMVDTSAWKTYTDSVLKFSIQYPDDITVLSDSTPGELIRFGRKAEAYRDFRDITTLTIISRATDSTPEQAFNNECPTAPGQGCTEKFEKVAINNAVGVKDVSPGQRYFLKNKNGSGPVLLIGLSPTVGDRDYSKFEKMLQTLSFLD